MTTFHLIRHGEKAAPPPLIVGRAAGIHLTALGQQQGEAIAEHLGARPIQHVFSSPLERAQETAAPLARKRKVEVRVAQELHEFDFGDWSGKSLGELDSLVGWREFNAFRSGVRPPGGEAMIEVQARVVSLMLRLSEEIPNGEVALVSHGDPLRAAVCYFLGMPLDLFHRIELSVASITRIILWEDGAQLIRMNEVVGPSSPLPP